MIANEHAKKKYKEFIEDTKDFKLEATKRSYWQEQCRIYLEKYYDEVYTGFSKTEKHKKELEVLRVAMIDLNEKIRGLE